MGFVNSCYRFCVQVLQKHIHRRVLKGSVVKHFFFVLLLLQCRMFGEAGKRGRSDLSWVPGNRNPRGKGLLLHGPALPPTDQAVQRLVGQVRPAGQDGFSKPLLQMPGGCEIIWLS